MNYTKKLAAAFNLKNEHHIDLLLDEDQQWLVNFAALTAYRLGLSPRTFSYFLADTISEDEVIAEMRITLLSEDMRGLKPLHYGLSHTDTIDLPATDATTDKEKKPKSVSTREHKPVGSYQDQIDALERQREELQMRQVDAGRAERDASLHRDEDAFNPEGETMMNVRQYADALVKHLMKTPRDNRAAATKDVISRLIDAANKMLYDPKHRADGKRYGWKVTPKYKPTSGMDRIVSKQNDSTTANYSENTEQDTQAILEGVVINELMSFMRNLINRMRGKPAEEPEKKGTLQRPISQPSPMKKGSASTLTGHSIDPDQPRMDIPVPPKQTSSTTAQIAKLTQAIVDTLKTADISPFSQTTMLNNVVKYVMKQVGAKYKHHPDNPREKLIDGYVEKVLAAKKGKKEMDFSLNTGKLPPATIRPVLDAYKDAFARRGYHAEIDYRMGRGKSASVSFRVTKDDNPLADNQDPAELASVAGTDNQVAMRDVARGGYDLGTNSGGDLESSTYERGALPDNGPETVQKQAAADSTGERLGLGASTNNTPRYVGFLVKDGSERRDLRVAVMGAKAYVHNGKSWVELPKDTLKRLWSGEKVGGFELTRTVKGQRTENHPLPIGQPRKRSRATMKFDDPPKSMLSRHGMGG